MTITTPKKIPVAKILALIAAIVTSSFTAAWAVSKRDSAHEERVNVAMHEFKSVKDSMEDIRREMGQVKTEIEALKISDARQTVVAERVDKTLTRIEDKIDSWSRIENLLNEFLRKPTDK